MSKIRILKTMPVKNGLMSWGDANRRLIHAVASDACEYDFWDLANTDIEKIVTESDNDQVAGPHAELITLAEEAGFHAVAMGCLLEPGVKVAKQRVAMPVVGALEACLHLAAILAPRYSIIIGNPVTEPGIRSRIEEMGLEKGLASIRSITSSPLAFAAENHSLPEQMLAEAKCAVEEDGAGCIITYGGLNVLHFLQSSLSVPVLNPQQCQVLVAEILYRALAQEGM